MTTGNQVADLIKAHRLISGVYADPRFPPPFRDGDLKSLTVALIWAVYVEHLPPGERFRIIAGRLGLQGYDLQRLIGADVPRYEPASLYDMGGCVGILPRAKRRCGRGVAHGFTVTNPVDGTWEEVGYCTRHREEGNAAWLAERRRKEAGGIPMPVPNRGGLLPSYLPKMKWVEIYRRVAGKEWEPPAVGVRADDWPVLEKVAMADPRPPKLTVVMNGVRSQTPEPEELETGVKPGLRLVTSAPQEP